MEKLSKCPESFDGKTFRLLYEQARIVNLTPEEMKTYKKSIEEYGDVILVYRSRKL
jgi:hypothetical protein